FLAPVVALLLWLAAPAAPPTRTLSLHDALPISCSNNRGTRRHFGGAREPWQSPGGSKASTSRTATARFCVPVSWGRATREAAQQIGRAHVTATYPWSSASRDRKSTRLNSSHQIISYA